uniref:sensor histidine kinase n=1 Tax=Ningiella ruwaisensis TaxID=2364274 RepID=UPI001F4F4E96|nr:ATP-binding protein [Ningiella ruwaisensis]
MSTLSFNAHEGLHQQGKTVSYTMAPSIRDVYAQRTALDKANNPSTEDSSHNPNRFSHLVSIMPAGVVVLDHRGIITLANQQASSLLDEPLEGELWRDVIHRAFTPKADDGHEVSMRNGKRVKIDISPLTEEKGQLIVITDLTETRQLQSRMSHMQRLSSLGKMVASLAHQVRTPLSSAMLYAENIKSVQPNDSMSSRFSEKLILRLKDLEAQVNDMLLFAKSGDNQIVKSMTSSDVINASVHNLEAQFAQANTKLSVTNKAKNAPLLCNITALSGAIGNLLGNALQAISTNQATTDTLDSARKNSNKGSQAHVELTASEVSFENKPFINFEVKDSGPGISEEELQRIFEPFYTTKSQGTGLGLAVVKTVAQSHKGFVKCQNRSDQQGAQFSIYVPVASQMTSQVAFQNTNVEQLSAKRTQKSRPDTAEQNPFETSKQGVRA